jgi:Domain of unknown function (DUF4345)
MRLALQITLALLSLLPLFFGLLGLVFGAQRFLPPGSVTPDLDSQYRFLSAWYLGLAVISWWMFAKIEQHTALFRIIALAIFLGGIGRLAAWTVTGEPAMRFKIVLAAELLFPLLIFWQHHVVRLSRRQG